MGRTSSTSSGSSAVEGKRVLLLVENLSVPTDRRVWQEACSLKQAGADVTVICPRGLDRDLTEFEVVDGIRIHRYPARPASGGVGSYVLEYASAALHMARLAYRLGRRRRFDVVHVSNPPDLLLLVALPLRLSGARLIFDQHDLVPELFRARYGMRHALVLRVAYGLERLMYRLADVVIVPNESFRRIATDRGRKDPADVFVVRNGPHAGRFKSGQTDPSLLRGKSHLLAYVGMMAPQDGVDHALRALSILREKRSDWHAVFVGDGDARLELVALADELGLSDCVTFPGFGDDEAIVRTVSTAAVCLSPEPKNELNDASTLIKIAEYMAMGRPVVCFDLTESRFTADRAAFYATPTDEASFAAGIDELLADEPRRIVMGNVGRARIESMFSWKSSERGLFGAYARCLESKSPASRRRSRISSAGAPDRA